MNISNQRIDDVLGIFRAELRRVEDVLDVRLKLLDGELRRMIEKHNRLEAKLEAMAAQIDRMRVGLMPEDDAADKAATSRWGLAASAARSSTSRSLATSTN
jgi:hypothetical protein